MMQVQYSHAHISHTMTRRPRVNQFYRQLKDMWVLINASFYISLTDLVKPPSLHVCDEQLDDPDGVELWVFIEEVDLKDGT